jgi:peptide methionine sulfoxide reductase MsrB
VAEVQTDLRWGSSAETADRICCFNRHYAEHSGYFQQTAFFGSPEARKAESDNSPITFYDSVTGNPLFRAPVGRTWAEFRRESIAHGWPSFRDSEVNTSHVRLLANGEAVSNEGTHLGHNLPDSKGNRLCINIVSVAGRPSATSQAEL